MEHDIGAHIQTPAIIRCADAEFDVFGEVNVFACVNPRSSAFGANANTHVNAIPQALVHAQPHLSRSTFLPSDRGGKSDTLFFEIFGRHLLSNDIENTGCGDIGHLVNPMIEFLLSKFGTVGFSLNGGGQAVDFDGGRK